MTEFKLLTFIVIHRFGRAHYEGQPDEDERDKDGYNQRIHY
jgi:hypothetical protein